FGQGSAVSGKRTPRLTAHLLPLTVTQPHTVQSRRAPRASPSSGTHRAASSGRRALRARVPFASRAVAGSWAPAPRDTGPHRDAAARRAGAPCALLRPA